MKIRITTQMYTRAQRIADAKGITFSSWAFNAICSYGRKGDKPKTSLLVVCEQLTRRNSVSVAISVPMTVTVTPARIRECIALCIEDQDNIDRAWPFKYDRATLDAMIQVERMLNSKSVCYADAVVLVDKRIAERKAEIASEEGKQKTKKGRK
jgi:hypothetical protein